MQVFKCQCSTPAQKLFDIEIFDFITCKYNSLLKKGFYSFRRVEKSNNTMTFIVLKNLGTLANLKRHLSGWDLSLSLSLTHTHTLSCCSVYLGVGLAVEVYTSTSSTFGPPYSN